MVAKGESQAYKEACASWVDEVVDHPRPMVEFLSGMRAPEPASHPDPRMGLTLGDLPSTNPVGPKTNSLKGRHTVQTGLEPLPKKPAMFQEGDVQEEASRAECFARTL